VALQAWGDTNRAGRVAGVFHSVSFLLRVFVPPSGKQQAADLLEHEEQLKAEVRHLDPASYRRRCEIEEELAEINRRLQRLRVTKKNPG
jgi:hypothetical protein